MIKELDNYDWENAFGESNINLIYRRTITHSGDESLYLDSFTREDVAEIFHLSEGANDEAPWFAIGKLKDGRFFFIDASCDYTGWDCRAGGSCEFSKTLDDVIRFGASKEARERFGIVLPELLSRSDETGAEQEKP